MDGQETLKRLFAFAACLLVAPLARADEPAGFVHASGTLIVDGAGTPLLLRGANLGGWLLWESYILKVGGDGWTESRLKEALIRVAGRDAAYAAFRAHRDAWTTRADLHRMRELGFNVVRLPLNAHLFDPDGHFDLKADEGWKIVDRVLDWCEEEGIYVVLDLHSAPGGQNGGGITDTDLKRGLFNGDSTTRYREETAALWGDIAARYRKRTIVAAFDLLNEPAVPNEEGGGEAVLAVSRQLIAAVRHEDTRHMLMVEGNWYATDFSMFAAPNLDGNLCYQFHKYWNPTSPTSIAPYLALRAKLNAPIWLGETGENSGGWYARCVDLMQANGIGWCFWPWKRLGGGCLEPVDAPAEWRRVAKALESGEGIAPADVAAGLRALVYASALGHIKEDHAVVEALTTTRVPQPVRPGRIEAEDFRVGSGTGYFNPDTKHKGGEYRPNEGVGIEECDEGGYDVGWIEAGEWLTWDVAVSQSGSCDLILRYASEAGGGALTLSLDGRLIPGLVEPASTGGWQDWADLKVPAIRCSKGRHILRLDAVRPGFNLDYLLFQPATGGSRPPRSGVPGG